MELLFNELSTKPISENIYLANAKMEKFAKAVSIGRKRGFRNIRSHLSSSEIKLSENYSLYEWLNNKSVPEILRNFLFGMIIQPFISEDDEETENEFLKADYYFEDKENGFEKSICHGLAAAFLYNSLSISIPSIAFWERTKLTIFVDSKNEVETKNVYNVSSDISYDVQEISSFVENLGEVTLVTTNIHPDNKEIQLADHHGKAELQVLCNKLKHNMYITEMRSTDYARGKSDKFINKIFDNGFIRIILNRTDSKFALLVKTTGRNFRETKAIAKILDDEYS